MLTNTDSVDANSATFISSLKELDVDLVFLCWWPQIIKAVAIKSVKDGWINLHPSFLPYGRGKHAYFWSIVEGYPFGVSMHFIDTDIDTGPVLYQEEIKISMTDTGESLYVKGVQQSIQLFTKYFYKIINGEHVVTQQENSKGSFRYANEIDDVTTIYPGSQYKAIDLINLLRARTFWKGDACKLVYGDKEYWLRLDIEEIK